MSPHVTPIRYRSLQALRALAAVSVMLHNANFAEVELLGRTNRFLPGASLGEVGVDLFFVLSGFLMVRTTGATAAGAEASRRFLMSRALRIYPAYWTVALVWAGLLAVWPVLGLGRPAAGFLQSILLLPAEARPQLAQGWSLVFEVYFYLVFGLMLLLPLVPRQWALTLWAAVLLVGVDAGFQGATPWTRLLANPLALEFLLGAAIAAVIDRPPRWPWALLLFGGPVLFLGEYARTHLGEVAARSEMLRVLLVGAPAGAVVMGAVQLERLGRLRPPAWLTALGARSYALYLVSNPVAALVAVGLAAAGLFTRGPAGDLLFVAAVVPGSLALAQLVHVVIERPSQAWSQRQRARAAAPVPPDARPQDVPATTR
jgi:peptidoglycan/LPS O-acetylase OafA/YrhL